jgi:hypothetical protein
MGEWEGGREGERGREGGSECVREGEIQWGSEKKEWEREAKRWNNGRTGA